MFDDVTNVERHASVIGTINVDWKTRFEEYIYDKRERFWWMRNREVALEASLTYVHLLYKSSQNGDLQNKSAFLKIQIDGRMNQIPEEGRERERDGLVRPTL